MTLNMSIPLRVSQTNRLSSTPYMNMGTDKDDNIFLYNETFLGTKTFVESNEGEDKYHLFSGVYDIDLSLGNKTVYIPLTNNTLNKENVINIINYNMDTKDSLEYDVIYLNQFSKENFINNPRLETIKVGSKVVGFNINLLNSNTIIRISLDPDSYFTDNIDVKFMNNSGDWSVDKDIYKDKFNIIDGGIIDDNLFELMITKSKNYYGDNDDNVLVGDEFENIFYGYGGADVLGSLHGKQWLGKDPAEIDVEGDYFIGGKGDDIIYGTRYGDHYEYKFEDGNDTIEDIGSLSLESDPYFKETIKDKLYLKGLNYNEDPYLSDVVITHIGNDVVLKILKTNSNDELINNTITIKNMLLKKLYNGVEYYQNAIEVINFDNGLLFLDDIINAALTYHGTENNDKYQGLDNYDNTMYGHGGDDHLYVEGGDNYFNGGVGNDSLCQNGNGVSQFFGGDGHDRLGGGYFSSYGCKFDENYINRSLPLDKDLGQKYHGGKGNDTIYGTKFGDYYYYDLGDGIDTIYEDAPNETGLSTEEKNFVEDKIIFGEGIVPSMVKILRDSATDTVKLFIDDSNHIRLWRFYKENTQIEKVIFKDGTVWDQNYIMEQGLIYQKVDNGEVVNDKYQGLSNNNNTLYGHGGDDHLYVEGGDNYFNGGVGNDSLCQNGNGVSQFFGGDGHDRLGGGYFSSYGCKFDENYINRSLPLDKDLGQKYHGGKGNDTIYGTKFGDYYHYNLGDGIDTIYENAPRINQFTNDKLIFTGISINDLEFLKTSNNLEVFINGVKSVVITNWYSNDNYQIEHFVVGSSSYDYNYANDKGIENRNILDAQ